jgi:DNA invertase Pin-like site-specific DNA recombinase
MIDTVVVYKVDRLTGSLADFAKIVSTFDGDDISFVFVPQQFNTHDNPETVDRSPRIKVRVRPAD